MSTAHHTYTEDEIQAALDTVDAIRATASEAEDELRAHRLPAAEILAYGHDHVQVNLRRWARQGLVPDVATAMATGWLDGLMVGVVLGRGEGA